MNAKESPSASTSFSVPSLVFFFFFFLSFLLQRLFFFSVSALVFLLQRLTFFFSLDVLPFFQPKILFQPKTFFSPRYFFSPKISPCLWFSASFLSFNVLPFSPSLVQPSIFKAIKNSSFGSVYPRPNILSSCFTFLLFE